MRGKAGQGDSDNATVDDEGSETAACGGGWAAWAARRRSSGLPAVGKWGHPTGMAHAGGQRRVLGWCWCVWRPHLTRSGVPKVFTFEQLHEIGRGSDPLRGAHLNI